MQAATQTHSRLLLFVGENAEDVAIIVDSFEAGVSVKSNYVR
jgi:hypothetical protein